MKLVLVRHTAVDVPPGVCYGQTDVGLKSTFPQEAEAVRSRLRGRRFDAVFTSPLSRCVRLARACGYTGATPDPRLMEMNFGQWEMRRWDEITDPRLAEWYERWETVTPTSGESFTDQRRRVDSFLSSLRATPGLNSALAFTHGGVMMQIMLLLRLCDRDTIFQRQPPYGHLLEVEI